MAGLVSLLLGQVAEVNNLMPVGHPHSSDQSQRAEEKTRYSPAVAVARFLSGNSLGQASADQMDDQHHDQGLEFHSERAAHHLG